MKKNFYCDFVAGTPVGFLNTNPDLKETHLSWWSLSDFFRCSFNCTN